MSIKKSVTFATPDLVDEVVLIRHLNDYSDEDIERLWHTRQEIKDSKMRAQMTVEKIMANKTGPNLCIRGLESRTTGAATRRRLKYLEMVNLLCTIQQNHSNHHAKQNDNGDDYHNGDEKNVKGTKMLQEDSQQNQELKELANALALASEQCKRRAYLRGLKDALECCNNDAGDDCKQEERSNKHKTPAQQRGTPPKSSSIWNSATTTTTYPAMPDLEFKKLLKDQETAKAKVYSYDDEQEEQQQTSAIMLGMLLHCRMVFETDDDPAIRMMKQYFVEMELKKHQEQLQKIVVQQGSKMLQGLEKNTNDSFCGVTTTKPASSSSGR